VEFNPKTEIPCKERKQIRMGNGDRMFNKMSSFRWIKSKENKVESTRAQTENTEISNYSLLSFHSSCSAFYSPALGCLLFLKIHLTNLLQFAYCHFGGKVNIGYRRLDNKLLFLQNATQPDLNSIVLLLFMNFKSSILVISWKKTAHPIYLFALSPNWSSDNFIPI